MKEKRHIISLHVEAIDRYSASTEERETEFCFLDLHEIRESPKKTQ